MADQQNNDAKAEKIEKLIDNYGNDVLRMCYVYTKDFAAAQDLFQEVFIKVFKNIDGFRGECSEKTWIIQIAINTCRDYLKSSWIKRIVSFNFERETITNIEKSVIENIEKKEVINSILNLPSKLKEVVLLYYYFGYNSVEISKIIGISESSVRSRLMRAREYLKKYFIEGGFIYE
ncbi:RNA polymerase sigma-70 factor, ECF subfamily [Caloramator quimbayensis]|uniref:RNA polymerase sigma-70 factor, ECF subfamily n=1 Tax=Caloramator quimbayensis TaxID=1147123 RepID=A0A1T4WEU7_9CLOT|nr:sigma-70 family RNA polymerase sigma factor [Caloramator quimbayensis]SKA75548.1 RNA polymerase sigma-70 factor, ECF subfamily [Caloramator quimbayensis]